MEKKIIDKVKNMKFNQMFALITTCALVISLFYVALFYETFYQADFIEKVKALIKIVLRIGVCILYTINKKTQKKRVCEFSIMLLIMAVLEIIFQVIGQSSSSVYLLIIRPAFYVCVFLNINKIIRTNLLIVVLGMVVLSNISWNEIYIMFVKVDGYNIEYLKLIFCIAYFMFDMLLVSIILKTMEKKTSANNKELEDLPQLIDLKVLLDENLISNEEFEIMKNRIVSIYKM